jgi:hypothetical protein
MKQEKEEVNSDHFPPLENIFFLSRGHPESANLRRYTDMQYDVRQ